MAVNYVLTQKGKSGQSRSSEEIYTQAKAGGELTLCKLSRKIAEGSTTVSDTDLLAVLNDLTKVTKRHLDNGEIVRLVDFSMFQIAIASESAKTAEKFNTSLINGGKVTFRQGIDLKEMLTILKYERKEFRKILQNKRTISL
jgi:predicted histone-like DNA-binding protein